MHRAVGGAATKRLWSQAGTYALEGRPDARCCCISWRGVLELGVGACLWRVTCDIVLYCAVLCCTGVQVARLAAGAVESTGGALGRLATVATQLGVNQVGARYRWVRLRLVLGFGTVMSYS